MPTLNKSLRYRAYLLRCWEERSQHPAFLPVWRFSLEDPHTGQRYGFANIEALVAFLSAELTSDKNKLRDEPKE